MTLLLDTPALLWFLLEDKRLTMKAKSEIEDLEKQIFVSPASLWEIAIKISLGKYVLPEPFKHFWSEQLVINQFTLLPIQIAHTACITGLPFHHRDPFDRMIIAQAITENIPVVSSDKTFDQYHVERVWN